MSSIYVKTAAIWGSFLCSADNSSLLNFTLSKITESICKGSSLIPFLVIKSEIVLSLPGMYLMTQRISSRNAIHRYLRSEPKLLRGRWLVVGGWWSMVGSQWLVVSGR